MDPKHSNENVGQGETSGAQAGAPSLEENLAERQYARYPRIILDPTQGIVNETRPRRRIDDVNQTHEVATGDQTGGVDVGCQADGTSQNLGVPAAQQTDELATFWFKHPQAVGIVFYPNHFEFETVYETGGTSENHRVADQTQGVAGHQTHGVATGDQTGAGTNRNHGVEAGGVRGTSNRGSQRRSVMPKVPAYIRQKYNSEDYDPLVATFGPYNDALHAAPDQPLALVEGFKAKAMEWFVQGTGKDANFWLHKVLCLLPDLRSCYTHEYIPSYSNEDLTRSFFQDACLAILVMAVANEEHRDINLLYDYLGAATVVSIIRDSLLLENQLPFWFIRDLLHSKFGVFKGEEWWKKHFITLCHGNTKSRKHTTMTTTTTTTTTTTVYWDEEAGAPAHFVEALKIAHLSGWKRENIELKHRATIEEERTTLLKTYYAVHSVTELKAKGINVEPNATNSFKNITFEPRCFSGTLKFPVDYVNYGTKAAYSNIIAYEMSPGNHTQDYTMTAYVHLMKSLLQSPKDVEELQANGIIINMLGSNEQVMNLYRDIYTFGANCSSAYGAICQKMEEHYNNKTKTWLAEFLHTYFRNPWTVIALFGSIFVVVLTFMQVYYAAIEGTKGGDIGKLPPPPPPPPPSLVIGLSHLNARYI